ncbi:MAG: aminotransferase class V-fold PLP-dependent enzyme, partial [Ghiorsea sp.]
MNIEEIRADSPILHQELYGKPLVYLDNAATTQKPQCVIDAVRHYYEQDNSNIHRGVHTLSERATADYEASRETIRAFFNAKSTQEVIFTRGATESINLVATSWGGANIGKDDEILISHMEHHSNI